jgi:hypothetical protein
MEHMWTKEDCSLFFKRTLGLELTSAELESTLNYLDQHKLTPISKGAGNNAGFSPRMLQNFINIARERTGSNLQDPRFKKVSEEILPALTFTLFLKKIGLGEYLIVSSDVPDIALVKYTSSLQGQPNRRVDALPIEAMFINEFAMESVSGDSGEEKIYKLINSKKFNKKYVPETVLLVTLKMGITNFNLSQLSNLLLQSGTNPFHQVWIFATVNAENCLIVKMCPKFEPREVNVVKELMPLMY